MRPSWQTILVLIGLALLVLIGYLNWPEIEEAFRIIKTSTWPILLAMPIIQLMSFYANARFYQSFYDVLGYRVKTWLLYKNSLALNFVNQMAPSVGVSAISFTSYVLRGQVPVGKITLVQYGRYALTFLTFMVLLLIGTLFVFFGGGIDRITVRLLILGVSATLVLAGIVIYIMSSKQNLNRIAHWLQRLIDRVASWFRKSKKPLIGERRIKHLLEEFHEGFELIIKERRRLLWPFVYALAGNFFEILTLYIVFLALDTPVNIGAVIIAYAAANAAGIISIIPGDVGVYEVTMIAAFTSLGIPVSIGLSATLLYRIINKGIFLPLGFASYSNLLRKGSKGAKPSLSG